MSAQVASNIEKFFEQLAASSYPLLHDVAGTLRIDVDEDGGIGHWLIIIGQGTVAVSRRKGRADAVVGTDQAVLGRLVTGEANAYTAGLRGQLRVDGDPRLMLAFDRLMPSPPAHHTMLPPVGRGAKKAARSERAVGTATRTAQASPAVAGMTRRDRAR
jgi:hypothetical protein